MSADPVTVHEAGSDINPYAYGYGNPTGYVDPDGRSAIAVFVIAAVVNATINIIVQQQTTGHVNWGWNGVLGAAVGGGIMAVGGPSAAFAVSFAQTKLRGSSLEDALRNATISVAAYAGSSSFSGGITDSVAASGGTVTPGVQFAAGLAGTAVGTHFGVVTGAALGQEPTWGSVGASLGSAFASAIATTVLGNAYQAVTEANTAGRARYSAAKKGDGVEVSEGSIVPGEPITDPRIRGNARIAWLRSRSGTLQGHEEGFTATAMFSDKGRSFDKIEWGDPSMTLAEARDAKTVPMMRRMPAPERGSTQYVAVHSHPFEEGTLFYVNAEGKAITALAGPSRRDCQANWLLRDLGFNVVDYVIANEGVYRIVGYAGTRMQWDVQRIAPLNYILRGP